MGLASWKNLTKVPMIKNVVIKTKSKINVRFFWLLGFSFFGQPANHFFYVERLAAFMSKISVLNIQKNVLIV